VGDHTLPFFLNMKNFNTDSIPDYVLHEAVQTTLGGEGLITISGGYKFRCPICGDSKINKNKKRGYILHSDGKWVYICHNECGSMSFLTFLKEYHPSKFRSIIFYAFKNNNYKTEQREIKTEAQKTYKANDLYQFKKGELLSIYDSHPMARRALAYCKERKIRKGAYSSWFVCIEGEQFFTRKEGGGLVLNDKGFPKGNEYRNRLIIPYYTFGKKWVQFDARALDDSFLRYRNLEDADRELYNIDWLDVSKPFFLLEGSINSTFIRNSVAFGGTKHLKGFLNKYPHIAANAHNGTFIWDNDDAGYNEMEYTINLGFNWFNWSTIKPLEKYMFKEDGELRTINDIDDLVLYTDAVDIDTEGYITYNSLKKYIESPVGGSIKIKMLYGNREKMRKEKFKKAFSDAREKRKTKELKLTWE